MVAVDRGAIRKRVAIHRDFSRRFPDDTHAPYDILADDVDTLLAALEEVERERNKLTARVVSSEMARCEDAADHVGDINLLRSRVASAVESERRACAEIAEQAAVGLDGLTSLFIREKIRDRILARGEGRT